MKRIQPRVALLIQTASSWSRQVLKGIATYAHEHGPWEVFIEPRGLYEKLRIPRGWKGDGIIARVNHPDLARAIRRAGLPAVNVSWSGSHSESIPKVVPDETACGELAARHFLTNRFEHFAYVGPIDQQGYVDRLGRQFVRSVRDAGYHCQRFSISSETALGEFPDDRVRPSLTRFLQLAPKPLGLFVWNDRLGRDTIAASQSAKLVVPHDVAVLSAEYDPLLSSLGAVPLSCVDMLPVKVGYEAARLLDTLLDGGRPPSAPVLVSPVGIVQRQSTDTYAVEDPEVAGALEFIRDHVDEPMNVTDVLRAVPLSRRALEQRFSRTLGRSPAAEIRRAKIAKAKGLLVETDLPIPVIADRVGFRHAEVMIRCFRREVGISPGVYRRSH